MIPASVSPLWCQDKYFHIMEHNMTYSSRWIHSSVPRRAGGASYKCDRDVCSDSLGTFPREKMERAPRELDSWNDIWDAI